MDVDTPATAKGKGKSKHYSASASSGSLGDILPGSDRRTSPSHIDGSVARDTGTAGAPRSFSPDPDDFAPSEPDTPSVPLHVVALDNRLKFRSSLVTHLDWERNHYGDDISRQHVFLRKKLHHRPRTALQIRRWGCHAHYRPNNHVAHTSLPRNSLCRLRLAIRTHLTPSAQNNTLWLEPGITITVKQHNHRFWTDLPGHPDALPVVPHNSMEAQGDRHNVCICNINMQQTFTIIGSFTATCRMFDTRLDKWRMPHSCLA